MSIPTGVRRTKSSPIAAANAQIARSPKTSDFYDLLGTALFNSKKDYPGADAALRKALRSFYPQIDTIALSDYKVRIINGQKGTGARTRPVGVPRRPHARTDQLHPAVRHRRLLIRSPSPGAAS